MKLTYIHHSGFLLETASCAMLFDYVEGTLPDLPKGKPLYVFVSHAHPDHYNKKIWREAADAAKKAGLDVKTQLTFVLSADIRKSSAPEELLPNATFLNPHEKFEDALLSADTLVSNDTGVAFLIEATDDEGASGAGSSGEGVDISLKNSRKKIYFAGDLNAWNWDGDEEDMELIRVYHEELQRIKGYRADLAFIPLDPRLGDEYIQGVTDYFDYCDADVVAPMHCWGKYEIIGQARAMKDRYPCLGRLLVVEREGQVFEI